jgi:hypothetical protein
MLAALELIARHFPAAAAAARLLLAAQEQRTVATGVQELRRLSPGHL